MPPLSKFIIEPKSPKSNRRAIKDAINFYLENLRERPTTGARIYSVDEGSVRTESTPKELELPIHLRTLSPSLTPKLV